MLKLIGLQRQMKIFLQRFVLNWNKSSKFKLLKKWAGKLLNLANQLEMLIY